MKKSIKEYIKDVWMSWVIVSAMSIIFGIFALFWPGITLNTIIFLIAIFLVLVGIFELVRGLRRIDQKDWWASVLIGLAVMALGVFFARNQTLSIATLTVIIGLFLIIYGIRDLMVGKLFDWAFDGWWTFSAVISIIAGIVVWAFPEGSSLALTWILGLYALINGSILLARALEAHKTYKKIIK